MKKLIAVLVLSIMVISGTGYAATPDMEQKDVDVTSYTSVLNTDVESVSDTQDVGVMFSQYHAK